MKWHRVDRSADGQDAARAKDWLTALSPLLLMMVVNYRWSAVWAVITAAAGYAAMSVCAQWLKLTPCRVMPALLCGVLAACCLPSAAPVWLSALAGLVGGVAAVIPTLLNRLLKREELSCPVYFPALVGYVAVRFIFPDHFTVFAQPVMWVSADAVAGATPLAALNGAAATDLSHLFWGFDAGSMGGGPVPAVLLCGVYLLLRRRLHLIPVGGMIGTVALLSWLLWDRPAYSLLAGGTLLAAVLLGDEALVHVGWKGRLTAGITAGVMTVLCRVLWQMDGSAVGVLTAGLLTPLLHVMYHWLCPYVLRLWEKIRKSRK